MLASCYLQTPPETISSAQEVRPDSIETESYERSQMQDGIGIDA